MYEEVHNPVNPRPKGRFADRYGALPISKPAGPQPSRAQNGTIHARPQHMLRHVKQHSIVHMDPTSATGSVTVYRDGKDWRTGSACMHLPICINQQQEARYVWTGQIANHAGPDVRQPAFKRCMPDLPGHRRLGGGRMGSSHTMETTSK